MLEFFESFLVLIGLKKKGKNKNNKKRCSKECCKGDDQGDSWDVEYPFIANGSLTARNYSRRKKNGFFKIT